MFLLESKLGFHERKYNEYRGGKLFQWVDFTDVREMYGLRSIRQPHSLLIQIYFKGLTQ